MSIAKGNKQGPRTPLAVQKPHSRGPSGTGPGPAPGCFGRHCGLRPLCVRMPCIGSVPVSCDSPCRRVRTPHRSATCRPVAPSVPAPPCSPASAPSGPVGLQDPAVEAGLLLHILAGLFRPCPWHSWSCPWCSGPRGPRSVPCRPACGCAGARRSPRRRFCLRFSFFNCPPMRRPRLDTGWPWALERASDLAFFRSLRLMFASSFGSSGTSYTSPSLSVGLADVAVDSHGTRPGRLLQPVHRHFMEHVGVPLRMILGTLLADPHLLGLVAPVQPTPFQTHPPHLGDVQTVAVHAHIAGNGEAVVAVKLLLVLRESLGLAVRLAHTQGLALCGRNIPGGVETACRHRPGTSTCSERGHTAGPAARTDPCLRSVAPKGSAGMSAPRRHRVGS